MEHSAREEPWGTFYNKLKEFAEWTAGQGIGVGPKEPMAAALCLIGRKAFFIAWIEARHKEGAAVYEALRGTEDFVSVA